MKKNFITKAVLIIILVVFLPFFTACPPHKLTRQDESNHYNQSLQGEVMDSSSTGLRDRSCQIQ